MHYTGKLYGLWNGKYLPLSETTETVEKIEKERDILLEAVKRIARYGKHGFKGDFTQAQIAIDALKEIDDIEKE